MVIEPGFWDKLFGLAGLGLDLGPGGLGPGIAGGGDLRLVRGRIGSRRRRGFLLAPLHPQQGGYHQPRHDQEYTGLVHQAGKLWRPAALSSAGKSEERREA